MWRSLTASHPTHSSSRYDYGYGNTNTVLYVPYVPNAAPDTQFILTREICVIRHSIGSDCGARQRAACDVL